MRYMEIFFCAAAAWFAAGLFTAAAAKGAAVDGAAAGTVCAVTVMFLPLEEMQADLALLLFLPLACVLPVREKRSWEERLMALLPALGIYALCALLGRQLRASLPEAVSAGLTCLAAAGTAAASYAMRGRFLPRDWREYFADSGQDRASAKRWRIYIPLALMAGAELLLLYGADRSAGLCTAAVLFIAGSVLCWGALYMACLMVSYRREKLTTLIDQSYHSEMQAFMNVIRSQRHDYNFHLHTLSGLIDSSGLDECRQYLHHLVQDSASINTFLPVDDPAIAALIFSFRTTALDYGIELHLDIRHDLKNVVTNIYETNKVIGNLLQNAIDEVRTHEDKSYGIRLYILKRGEDCIIHTANKIILREDTQRRLQEMYRPGFSTKTDHEGIGLASVQNLLRRYRGTLYARVEGDVIHCFACIPLRMKGGQT